MIAEGKTRTMPLQRPGQSKQDYGTPQELLAPIKRRWGNLTWDLAAHDDGSNAKAEHWIGPSRDSLNVPWYALGGLLWLNPPFENIEPWILKCAAESKRGAKIIQLVPASIGAEWFRRYAYGEAQVVGLSPRIKFEGCHVLFPKSHPRAGERKCEPECMGCATYPKDCMLLLWGDELHVHPDGYEQNRNLRGPHILISWRWDIYCEAADLGL